MTGSKTHILIAYSVLTQTQFFDYSPRFIKTSNDTDHRGSHP